MHFPPFFRTQPDAILQQFDSLVDSSLGTEKTFLLTMHTFKALRMVNEKARGKVLFVFITLQPFFFFLH